MGHVQLWQIFHHTSEREGCYLLVILYPLTTPLQHYVEVIDSKNLVFLSPGEVCLHHQGMLMQQRLVTYVPTALQSKQEAQATAGECSEVCFTSPVTSLTPLISAEPMDASS